MRLMSISLTAAFILVSLTKCSDAQIEARQVDDFSIIGSAAGWVEGGNSPNAPIQNVGLGLDGLAGHLQNESDGSGAGGRWHTWNDDARWSGDYLAAGVSSISFDFDNVSGNGTDAFIRIGLNSSDGGWFTSEAINVVDGSGWQSLNFDLSSLTHVTGGTGLLSDTLDSVNRFQILSAVNTPTSATGGNFLPGDQIVADFRVDNITAVPEPSAFLLAVVGLSGLVVRRRK